MTKLYAESKVEIQGFTASHYDAIMNVATAGRYGAFIKKSIKLMHIQPEDEILDLGAGTGRNACIMRKFLNDQGKIIGLDVSPSMGRQFHKKCDLYPNVLYVSQRIDVPFFLGESFDKIWISFVIHGFPHEVRQTILENIYSHLKPGGSLYILDFSEFNMSDMPPVYRFLFKTIECKYAFDYIEKDWKAILKEHQFVDFQESFFIKGYVRLLKAGKRK